MSESQFTFRFKIVKYLHMLKYQEISKTKLVLSCQKYKKNPLNSA